MLDKEIQEAHIEEATLPASPLSKNDQIHTFALRLASLYGEGNPASPSSSLFRQLDLHEKQIGLAQAYFKEATKEELNLTYASEWLLDNYYVVRQAVRQIREDLPSSYYQQLPSLTTAPFAGLPRVYAIAREFLRSEQLLFNAQDLQGVLQKYQERVPLTMGELWALPTFLRYVLIEAMAVTLTGMIPPAPPEAQSEYVNGLKAEEVISNAIISLRVIFDQDWKSLFESVSLVEQTLRTDPASVYAHMDFRSRDLYRKAVEELAAHSRWNESQVAARVVELAASHSISEDTPREDHGQSRQAHVGYYLIDRGRAAFEQHIGFRPPFSARLSRLLRARATLAYTGSILLLAAALLALSALLLFANAQSILQPLIGLALLFIPALTIAVSLVNWMVTILTRPRMLPKLELEDNLPAGMETIVVIPALLSTPDDAVFLASQVEQHYLRNPESGLFFGLLTDFEDADQETLPVDDELIQQASEMIDLLNLKYPSQDGRTRFYLFHRRRLWNPSEGKWMGWERKRGKLHELNRLLRGGQDHTFSTIVGDPHDLHAVRYVITLDADTVLPINTAARLVGALAHPLNQAEYRPGSTEIVSGYSVLQPRMEIKPTSVNKSWFSRIFSGDSGIDLYSLAVSDAYQDLFGEGIYVGKGIYDIDAFERSVNPYIPPNTLLSHDLLEGLLGRAGLVTDVTMVEDYPPHYLVFANRQHRWVRGDWQILPWLLASGSPARQLSLIDRWKMIDNLRRSLLSPALLLLLVAGIITMPALAWFWVSAALLTPALPALTTLLQSLAGFAKNRALRSNLQPLKFTFLRWLLLIAFLPYEAALNLEAIFTTLWRMFVTRRNLLEWTTAHSAMRWVKASAGSGMEWREMGFSALLGLGLLVSMAVAAGQALSVAGPVIFLWMAGPVINTLIARAPSRPDRPLTEDQNRFLRRITRHTWAFFERFVGPEDHWLPPDHFQESPIGAAAHRTSPTNIGLLLTSTLAAYDLGFVDQFGFITRLAATFDTLEQLTRYRGHFLNWYDTITLQPLNPRYVSVVDSGNLAASLLITARACEQMNQVNIFRWQRWQSYLDTLAILQDTLSQFEVPGLTTPVRPMFQRLEQLHTRILAVQDQPALWYRLYQDIINNEWPGLMKQVMAHIEAGRDHFTIEQLRELQQVINQVENHHQSIERTVSELVPWILVLEDLPSLQAGLSPGLLEQLNQLTGLLPYSPVFGKIKDINAVVAKMVEALRGELDTSIPAHAALNDWLVRLEGTVNSASANATILLASYRRLAAQADRYIQEMDFRFLYSQRKRIFHIGYNLDAAQLDRNFYDLLASEARIASLVAIAKNDVPHEHWLHLNRPVTRVNGARVLLSWSATMFEYLMPPLFLRSYPGTLLDESTRGAIEYQIEYGRSKGVPWGISESGFYQFDASQSYQYRAFGAPGLGFKRGLGDDLVIAPYASLMAISYNPQAVYRNIEKMLDYGLLGLYGFYEAVDFTPNRLPLNERYAVVKEFMAHHQGMVLLAMANYFCDDLMIRRMHSDARIRSIELLLQEQVPYAAPLQNPQAQDVRGTQRLEQPSGRIDPWQMPLQTPIPQLHLLSNGSYSVLISNSSSGGSRWKEIDLTRWQPDAVLDPWGLWVYIQDSSPQDKIQKLTGSSQAGTSPWSVGMQPIPGDPANMQVTYHAHMAVFRRTENGIVSNMEVTVPPDDPVELRRIHFSNTSARARRLRVTSYGEVILTQQANDARHPAFNKLFIQSEYVPEYNLLIFKRRPRSAKEAPVFVAHMLTLPDGITPTRAYETDRRAFIGRGLDLSAPQALSSPAYLTGSTGATLDPIMAIGQEIDLEPGRTAQLAFLVFAAPSRQEIINLARRYSSWNMVQRAFRQSDIAAQSWLGRHNLTGDDLCRYLQVFSALQYPFKNARASTEAIAANRLGQSGLWRFGVSGDFPILLVELDDETQLDLLADAIEVHRFLRSRRFLIDLVIVNAQMTNYGAELNSLLYRLIDRKGSGQWFSQRGGIFILYADQINPEERTLLQAAARMYLHGSRGSLADQLPGYSVRVPHLPEFTPARTRPDQPEPGGSSPAVTRFIHQMAAYHKDRLLFWNGYGGFTPDGREYVIEQSPGRRTPAPWVNVIGYPEFGFMVTEAGSSCTWALNSGENRLTPWSNDPVRDPTGEALYLRDEETGAVWTPTPQPAGDGLHFCTRHGAGYTIFEHHSHGLNQRLRLFASPEDPVKVVQLRLENTWSHTRRITATHYVEWVLGTLRQSTQPFIVPEYDTTHQALLAFNPYSPEFSQRAAFLAASHPIHGLTADRTEFIGRNGSLQSPVSFQRIGLETRIEPGEDPCAVLQVHVDLAPGAAEEIYFLIGQGSDRDHALALVEKYHDQQQVESTWQAVHDFWDHLLGTIQVKTPDPAIDLMLNRWLLYQALSCRIWGRSAFYQSSGAYGFRDQLQDVLSVLFVRPEIARAHILEAAAHQFEEGDVLHWWHPPSSRGVRTRFSDDLLWLPYVVAEYIQVTGDTGILAERIPFLKGELLKEGEDERYGLYPAGEHGYSLFEHCRRAIERGATTGPHGLPLMGSGDWNDGMNRVGIEGQGESVWLGWFLYDNYLRFARICEIQGENEAAGRCRARASRLAADLEQHAWDGSWYRRAYYDDGTPLGSSQNRECQIDAIAQSWAVISGAGDPTRARQAMQSVLDRLVRPDDRLILLFTPPFDQTRRDPGYIKGYLPGIRENGGQYTHAAIWTAWAVAMLKDGSRAGALFRLLNPVYQADKPEKADTYRVEPYVVAADIYSVPPYVRRGGWTWYTGSSGWLYRLGLEALLGFRLEGGQIQIDPVVPDDWSGFEITYRNADQTYQISVNKAKKPGDPPQITINGEKAPEGTYQNDLS